MKLFKTKIQEKDFVESMLPKTRKEVFFDTLKIHWRTFLLLGLLILVCSLPIHILSIVEDLQTLAVINQLNENVTEAENLNANLQIIAFKNVLLFIKALFLVLLTVVLCGIFRIARQYSWLENVTVSYDFFLGVKQNVGQILPVSLIMAVFYAFSQYTYNFMSVSSGNLSFLMIVPLASLFLIFLPICGYFAVAVTVYSNSLLTNLKIAFMLYVKNPFKAIFVTLLCLIPFIPLIIPSVGVHIVGRILSSVFVPIITLAWTLFSMNQLDQYINSTYHPELVDRGLYKEDKN